MKFISRLIVLLLAIIFGFWLSSSSILEGTTVGGWMDSIMNVLPDSSEMQGSSSQPQSLSSTEENTSQTTPTTAYPEQSDIDFEFIHSEIIRLVNELRTEQELEPLSERTELNQAAQIRAEESGQVFSHTRPDGRDAFSVFNDGINYNYRIIGENLGMATYHKDEVAMAELIFEGWVNSEGHYENMVRPDYSEIGIGLHYDGEFLYAAQMFGTPM